ncbi:MAG: hypothetical protein JWO00_68 [Candidatus Parcubacteria bacterium]|nr:hypothetical protein [Candidatus Parcubacteria bacterium]
MNPKDINPSVNLEPDASNSGEIKKVPAVWYDYVRGVFTPDGVKQVIVVQVHTFTGTIAAAKARYLKSKQSKQST